MDKPPKDRISEKIRSQKKGRKISISKIWRRFKYWILLFGVGIGLILKGKDIWSLIKGVTTSQHETFIENTRLKGFFLPPELIYNDKSYLYINYGGSMASYRISQIKKGVEFTPQDVGTQDENLLFGIKLKIINDRLFIATQLRDIQLEHEVLTISYDQWDINKSNIFNYKDSDESLEVYDKGANVIFSAYYSEPNTLNIRGYYVGNYILIATDSFFQIMPRSKRDSAMQMINKIPKRFR